MSLSTAKAKAIYYGGSAFPVEGLGPGKRIVIWFRGCTRHCPGCIAPELFQQGSDTTMVTVVAQEILDYATIADGLTISGGEPFEQAEGLLTLVRELRKKSDIEILIYSGFTREELEKKGPIEREILSHIDILIDGPFFVDNPNTLRWRGSDNQRVHLLSERSRKYVNEALMPFPEPRKLQVQLVSERSFRIIGIPRRQDVHAVREMMEKKGFSTDMPLAAETKHSILA